MLFYFSLYGRSVFLYLETAVVSSFIHLPQENIVALHAAKIGGEGRRGR